MHSNYWLLLYLYLRTCTLIKIGQNLTSFLKHSKKLHISSFQFVRITVKVNEGTRRDAASRLHFRDVLPARLNNRTVLVCFLCDYSTIGPVFVWGSAAALVLAYFLAATVLVRFHSLRVWSSDTVTRQGSTGWNASARTPSKWLRSVYLGFHVFLNEDSLLDDSCGDNMKTV